MCRRLIWALAHSTVRADQQRGLDLAQAALDNDARTQDQDRELRYFLAGERHVSACAVAVARCCCACMCANVRPCFRVPYCYLARVTAVAMFKLGRCLDARRALASLLQARTQLPHFSHICLHPWCSSVASQPAAPTTLSLEHRPSLCLQDYPEFRQAASLKAEVDDRVVRDGLLGLGLAGAVAAIAVGALMGGRRR